MLLGDAIELRHGPVHRALEAARPVLAELGAALRPPREVVIVPGNHDHQLVTPWLERRASVSRTPLGLESAVDRREGELLAAVAAALEPAQVRAAYPGVWLREDVYATHGHYSDRHNTVPLIERLGVAVMARIVDEPPGGPAAADDYEDALAPMYAFIDGVVRRRPPKLDPGEETFQTRSWRRLSESDGAFPLRKAALRGGLSMAVASLNLAGLGPLRADVSGAGLREGGLYGIREVVRRLRIPAEHVIFGHTHRAGPLPDDPRDWWRAPPAIALWNTGSWQLERLFLGREPNKSPYRPGFCVQVSPSGPPELTNLLDGIGVDAAAAALVALPETSHP